jgi:hypothetical protein
MERIVRDLLHFNSHMREMVYLQIVTFTKMENVNAKQPPKINTALISGTWRNVDFVLEKLNKYSLFLSLRHSPSPSSVRHAIRNICLSLVLASSALITSA